MHQAILHSTRIFLLVMRNQVLVLISLKSPTMLSPCLQAIGEAASRAEAVERAAAILKVCLTARANAEEGTTAVCAALEAAAGVRSRKSCDSRKSQEQAKVQYVCHKEITLRVFEIKYDCKNQIVEVNQFIRANF